LHNSVANNTVDAEPCEEQRRHSEGRHDCRPKPLIGQLLRVPKPRKFQNADMTDGAIVVSRSMADRFWPNRNVVGRRLRLMLAAASTPFCQSGSIRIFRQITVRLGLLEVLPKRILRAHP
jgi:hypothetical protein